MGIKDRLFSAWSRDHHKAFAEAIAKEIETKADSTDLEQKVSKSGDTLSGNLIVNIAPNDATPAENIYPFQMSGKNKSTQTNNYNWQIGMCTLAATFLLSFNKQRVIGVNPSIGIFWESNSALTLGYKNRPWANTFTKKISNGDADILVPSKSGTLALVSDIEDILRKYNLIPAEETTTEEQN